MILMENMYFTLCEDFEGMAQEHYRAYCQAKQEYDPSAHTNLFSGNILPAKKMQWSACSAVIFEAIAIEAYVNLLGLYLIQERYYTDYESKDAQIKDRSTLAKLKGLCKKEINKPYPADHSLEVIRDLFFKRNNIVHTKASTYSFGITPFDYRNIEGSYADYTSAFSKEIGFLYEGLDEQMTSYSSLVRNINALLDKDMLQDIRTAPLRNMESMFKNMNSLNQNPPEL